MCGKTLGGIIYLSNDQGGAFECCGQFISRCVKKAIRRFIARRGATQEIYTDNGTNFVGANRELQEEKNRINGQLGSTFTDANTQWRFNPPAAPHMGGCWERLVRSVKVALSTIPTENKLDEESFSTMLTEAEHMINSRPLTFVSLESADAEALSPNHFLLLSSSGVRQLVKGSVEEGVNLKNSWNMIQDIISKLWRRWIVEYLPMITRRTKWFHDVRPIKTDELVLIADERIRNNWIRGRVVKTYPGKDGIVRRADVQTNRGMLQRPVAKLAILDVDGSDAEEKIQATLGGGC